jgi:hypothetical protein
MRAPGIARGHSRTLLVKSLAEIDKFVLECLVGRVKKVSLEV